MEWLGTAITAGVLVIVVGLVIYTMFKDKKNGKSSCGCDCADCSHKCGK